MTEAMRKQPSGFGTLLFVLEKLLTPSQEIAVLGSRENEDTQALISEVHKHFLPHTVVALAEDKNAPIVEKVAFLQERERGGGEGYGIRLREQCL